VTFRPLRRALAGALAGAALLAAGAACARQRPVPLSVQLQGEPRILRVPPDLVRTASGTPIGVLPGRADAFYGRIAPALERWGVDIRIVVEPAYVGAILLKASAYDTLLVSPSGALGLAQLTPAVDAELREQSPVYPWMAAEVASWPRDVAVHGSGGGAAPLAPAAVRARLAAGTLGARNEYLFDAERSARAGMLWVKLLQTRWTRDLIPGGDAAFARRTLAPAGGELTDDQVLDLGDGELPARPRVDAAGGAAARARLGAAPPRARRRGRRRGRLPRARPPLHPPARRRPDGLPGAAAALGGR
jgi:hypothetical protein